MRAARNFSTATRSSTDQPVPVWAALCVGLWAIVCLLGFLALLDYSTAPGNQNEIQLSHMWPATSDIEREPRKQTLVTFLHPRCPCSRASLRELARLDRGETETLFVFFAPETAGPEWLATDLWVNAAAFDNAQRIVDRDGIQSSLFGAEISGCMMLFNSDGSLLFKGGITSGRGHEGDSEGKIALSRLLKSESVESNEPSMYPVFGCPIQTPNVCTNCMPEGE